MQLLRLFVNYLLHCHQIKQFINLKQTNDMKTFLEVTATLAVGGFIIWHAIRTAYKSWLNS